MFRPGRHFFGGGDHHQAGSVLVVVSRAILNERGARASDERRGRGLFGFMFGGDMIGIVLWLVIGAGIHGSGWGHKLISNVAGLGVT